jgi:hypothetical protein
MQFGLDAVDVRTGLQHPAIPPGVDVEPLRRAHPRGARCAGGDPARDEGPDAPDVEPSGFEATNPSLEQWSVPAARVVKVVAATKKLSGVVLRGCMRPALAMGVPGRVCPPSCENGGAFPGATLPSPFQALARNGRRDIARDASAALVPPSERADFQDLAQRSWCDRCYGSTRRGSARTTVLERSPDSACRS